MAPPGPSEEDKNCTEMMGLSKADIADITAGWNSNLKLVHHKINNMSGFSWDQFTTIGAPDVLANSSKFNKSCTAWFQSQCHNHSVFWTDAVYFSLKVHETPLPSPGKPLIPWTLGQFRADLVAFLLAVSGQRSSISSVDLLS